MSNLNILPKFYTNSLLDIHSSVCDKLYTTNKRYENHKKSCQRLNFIVPPSLILQSLFTH